MQAGLWKTSRHPNYFGESLVWLGLAIMSLTYPWGWLALISPAVITYLLLFVSGIPIQEKGKDQNPAWQEYASQTPRFVPFIGDLADPYFFQIPCILIGSLCQMCPRTVKILAPVHFTVLPLCSGRLIESKM